MGIKQKISITKHLGCDSISAKNLDILGSKYRIRFGSKTGTFQTTIGGYTTLIIGVISLSTFLIIIAQYFRKVAPVVTTSKSYFDSATDINLYDGDLWTTINAASGPVFYRKSEILKYFTVTSEVKQIEYKRESSSIEEKIIKTIPYVSCEEMGDPKVLKHIKTSASFPRFQELIRCPDFNDPEAKKEMFINKDTANNTERIYTIKIYPCSLEEPRSCANHSQLVPLIANFMKVERVIEATDFKNPLRSIQDKDSLRIDLSLSKKVIFQTWISKIYDDDSQLKKPRLNQEFSRYKIKKVDFKMRDRNEIYCSKQQIELRECQEYISFDYHASEEVVVIMRNYQKVSTLMGEFGGILKILTSCIIFFYSIYNLRALKTYLKEAVFGQDQASVQELKNLFLENGEKEEEVEKAIDHFLRKRISAKDLMKKLNYLEIIESSLFEPFEMKLIPLVLLKERQLTLRAQIKRNKTKRSSRRNSSRENTSQSGQNPEIRSDDSFERSQGQFGENRFIKAYRSLNDLDLGKESKGHSIREYMLSQVSGIFENRGEIDEKEYQRKIERVYRK